MIKSTASAGPVELHSSPSSYFLWEFPEKPVSVRLSLDVVDRIEREVMESFRAITARGSEVGGLLLGRAEPGENLQTIVEGYELFPCDYTRGPLYLLSEEEKNRLEETIRRKKSIPGQAGSVVGLFRSNTRKDLALDDEDLGLYAKYFARPEQVFLLVKPYAAKPSVGGIFIWENQRVRNEASYIEFPFRRSELSKGAFARSIVQDAPKSKETPAPEPAAATNGHKTGARAQVLPFSLKRDEEPAVPVPPLKREDRAPVVALSPKPEEAKPSPLPVVPVMRKPAEAPVIAPAEPAPASVPQHRAGSVSDRSAEEAKVEEALVKPAPVKPAPAATEKAKPAEKATAAEKTKPAEKAKPVETPETRLPKTAASTEAKTPAAEKPTESISKIEPLRERSAFGGKKLWALFGGLTMLGLAGGTLYYLKSHTASSVSAPAGNASLQLKAEPSNGQLLVSWNTNSQVIKTAQNAVLSINDGAKTEDVPLDLTQLRAGSIMYSPLSGDVSFRLEVKGVNETSGHSDFVRVPVNSVPPPAGNPANSSDSGKPQQQSAQQQAQAAGKTAEAARLDPAAQNADQQQQTPQPAQPRKPFSLAARVRQPEPTDLPEAPSVQATGAAVNIRPSVPSRLPAPLPPPTPAPAAAPAPAPAPTANVQPAPQAPVRVGGKVVEPKLLRRVDAIYPPMARQARVGGVVRLQATIGADGKIRRVEVLSGPPLLRQAAVDAVQKWQYAPQTLNGTPVVSTTDVEVNFNLNTR
jgi:protein TonB